MQPLPSCQQGITALGPFGNVEETMSTRHLVLLGGAATAPADMQADQHQLVPTSDLQNLRNPYHNYTISLLMACKFLAECIETLDRVRKIVKVYFFLYLGLYQAP